ncbi:hypothetical protein [Arthrobacter caoxuetaonis]|uniref:Uncharacterized protein n=1 Tax=Arthrobacter caoxuetaonis TaxID=2886935 RepID=A0A9X1MI79_9MICC|nr:hypothetical protein [Arthrobacter caoxuetaonis]MCC3299655.1 hypothetical protein [Arthrobacter caoxuetaonis]USQ59003.1 hypothetical protein NF551_18020 [Arthrobacter caoxuetaonis]
MSRTRIVITSIAAIVGLAVVTGLLGLGLGWFNAGTKVISAGNVKKQHTVVIRQYNDMIAAADNACSAQEAASGTKTDKDALVLESPIAAREATFRSLVSKYSATVDNPFEGQIVVPDGYPTSAELSDLDTSDWCTVGAQLKDLKG